MATLVFILLLFLLPPICLSQGVFIDCGSTVNNPINGVDWLPDIAYVSAGTAKVVPALGFPPTLATLRTFPLQGNLLKKFCYEIPIVRTRKYLIRTTYYYGGVNGNVYPYPPVFDQIVDGTLWDTVNTTQDYARGSSTTYEGIFLPTGKNLSVCLAANAYTDSDPFISALEIVPLLDQVYNSTDFRSTALSLVSRHSFGHDGPVIGYPDDRFHRHWEPFGQDSFPQSASQNLAADGIWNLPPRRVFKTRLARSLPEPLTLMWPPSFLPLADPPYNYYIALYFTGSQTSGSSTTLDITVNGITYYNNLTVIPSGVVVFANLWPLVGMTNLTLTPAPGSTSGPLINAGEVFQVLSAGRKTLARDVIAMINLRSRFQNPPADWKGDPCLPNQYPWTGVSCSEGPRIRVVHLNLTSMCLAGSISPNIAKLTALTSMCVCVFVLLQQHFTLDTDAFLFFISLLGNNCLSGTIPDLGSLHRLEILHLEENSIGGTIPRSLGTLKHLHEVFVQNNNLTGRVPNSLAEKPRLNLRYTPGNPLLTPSP